MLIVASGRDWLDAVLEGFDEFLLDHAANERKASAMAMSMVAHYPDKARLVTAMIELALEELNHFRQVVRIVSARGLTLAADEKDPYVNGMQRQVRGGKEDYFLDRLLAAAVIEARGAERFALLAEALADPELATFYMTLARSEKNHHLLFVDLAHTYFPAEVIAQRLDEWLQIEAGVLASLEIRPRLH